MSLGSTRRVAAGLLFALSAGLTSTASAADINGRIKGTVIDPQDAVVPGITVTAVNQATGFKFTTKTQADGSYFFAQIPVGTYSVAVSAPGFQAFRATGIVINIDQEYVEPIHLAVGEATQTLEVAADAVQVNSTDMQLDNVVEAAQMTELPNISRSFTTFETIEPGVQSSNDRFGGYSADGAQTQQSSFLINGADVNDIAINTVGLSPILDAVNEFNLVTGPLNAEYDRNSGGIVSAILKQGTNQFHGDAFEFYRDTFLNTGNYFANVAATPTTPQHKLVTPYHQNIFGATVGGPILKDKLFFFGGYQGTRQRVPNGNSAAQTTVFSANQLAGNFSDDLTGSVLGYSFSSNAIPGTLLSKIPGCSTPGTTWAQCAAANGGKFPTSSFNSIASALTKQYVPAANQGTDSYVFNNVDATTTDQYLGRFDYQLNPANQFTFIGIRQKSNSLSTTPFTGATLPGFGEIDGNVINQYTFDYVHQFSATLINDFAVHYVRFNDAIVNNAVTVDPASLGFAIHPQNASAASVPTINLGGYFSLGFSNNGPQPRIDQNYQIDDNISKSLGHHQLKFGYDGRRFNVSNPFSANNSGTYGFATSGPFSSGDPGLDFLLGNPSGYSQGTGATIQAYAYLNYLYAQDTWKLTDALTLSYGLGYQIDTPLHNQQYAGEGIACFIPGQTSKIFPTAPTGLNYPGDPGCTNTSQAHTRYNELGPRLGFAWAPDLGILSAGASKKLAVRGGFGIYYNRTEEETSLNNLDTPPYGVTSSGAVDYGAQATAFANPYQDIDTGATYANKFPFTFPTAGQSVDYSIFEPMDINTYDRGFRSPYSENFQLSVEREFPSKLIARLSYVGAFAHHNQIAYEGNAITQAGHDACLADTARCGSRTTSGYRNLQDYYYPSHTQYGAIDPNTGIPAIPTVGVVTSEGGSNYNSLQASVLKSTTHGLDFQLSYTYSHALDDGSSYENSGYGGSTRGYNQFNRTLNYGNSAFDARHRLVFAPIYTVPALVSHSAFSPLNVALSGWQISGISTVATGFPFDISYGGGSSNSLWCSSGFSFYACPDEPNQVGSIVRTNPRTYVAGTNRTQWFDAKSSGFSQAPLGQFGNESRNRFHGPGQINTNLIIAKNFLLQKEGPMRLQIRMESDNVFNHTNFNNPSSTFSTTTAGESATTPGTLSYGAVGQISSAANGRATQLAAKFYF